jgi:hypothetical protein
VVINFAQIAVYEGAPCVRATAVAFELGHETCMCKTNFRLTLFFRDLKNNVCAPPLASVFDDVRAFIVGLDAHGLNSRAPFEPCGTRLPSQYGPESRSKVIAPHVIVRLTQPSWSWPLKLPKHAHRYDLVWPQRNLHRRILDRKFL